MANTAGSFSFFARKADEGSKAARPEPWPLRGFLALASAAGTLMLVLYSTKFGWPGAVPVLGAAGLIAAAAMLVGALLGFLFGLPHSAARVSQASVNVREGGPNATQASASAAEGDSAQGSSYSANTNLEQISDWVTKILVGIGLTQIGTLASQMQRLATFVAPAIGNRPESRPAAMVIIIWSLVIGFLLGFLEARLKLIKAFSLADVTQIRNEMKTRQDRDTRALALLDRQLAADAPDVEQDDLDQAVAQASPMAQVNIFARTRSDLWQGLTPPLNAARVFRALIHADNENRFHRNHGELARALIKQAEALERRSQPADAFWQEARSQLSKAIAIRDTPPGGQGFGWYEVERAHCQIKLDPDAVDAIRADVEAAWSRNEDPRLQDEVASWIATYMPGWPAGIETAQRPAH